MTGRPPSMLLVALALWAAVSSTGCAIVLAPSPGRKWTASDPPRCNRSYAAPYVDLAVASLALPATATALFVASANAPRGSDTARNTAIVGGLVVGAALMTGFSGWAGLDNVSRCRAIHAGLEARGPVPGAGPAVSPAPPESSGD